MDNIDKKIQNANIKFFKRDSGLQYFGILSKRYEWEVEDLPEEIEGCVQWDLTDLTKITDGKIHINKLIVEKEDYSHDNLIALLIHEIMHILKKHGKRKGTRDSKLWNIANDHVIDRDIKSITNVKFYQNVYNIIEELDKKLPKCTEEEAYEWLMQNQNKLTITPQNQKGQGEGQGEEQSGPESIKVKENSTGKEFNVNIQQDINELNADEKNKMNQEIDQFVAHATALKEILKSKGELSSGLVEYLDNLLKVEIPWQDLLEKAIKTNVSIVPDDRSWKRPNIYFHHLGINLPGQSYEEVNDGVGHLYILLDRSGSTSDMKTLKEMSGIIAQSIKYFEKIIILVHDVKIHQIKEFDKDNVAAFQDFIKNEGLKGGGGTSHTHVFNYIENEVWKDKDLREDLSMVIAITDQYSNITQIYKNYNWIKSTTPLIFLVVSGGRQLNYDLENIEQIIVK